MDGKAVFHGFFHGCFLAFTRQITITDEAEAVFP